MRQIIFITVILLSKLCAGQNVLICDGKKLMQVKSTLYINGFEQKQFISFQKMNGDFVLGLSDTSFKIIGFRLVLPCLSKSVYFDVITKEYQGNRIKANDPILKSVAISDYFTIDCITVEKLGNKYSISGLYFEIIE